MKLGSLFDGIGGFPLAATMNGIRPVWASEIEPFPMAVTAYRFPEMKHMGDITKLHGESLPVVDIIAGGSPCQDLSVAGKREGLSGDRSGLFMEQVRIVKEMRKQDGRRMRNHRRRTDEFIRPRYMLWENVPGAFSVEKHTEPTSTQSSKRSAASKRQTYLYLDRREGHGLLPGLLWEKDSLLLGEYWMLNFGVSPKEEIASSLSQILEDTVPEKYYLSPTACGGIIRRSEKRGKELPAILKQALLMQAGQNIQNPRKTM